MSHAMELLAEAAGVATKGCGAARRCLDAAVHSGSFDVYVDGVDEICPFFKTKILRILELLLQNSRPRVLWVSSRPEVAESLSRTLRCAPVSLRALSREDQTQFLRQRWGAAHGVPADEFSRLAAEVVSAMAQSDRSASRSAGGGLLDAPLRVQMAAEAFAVRAMEALRCGDSLLRGGQVSLLDLYDFFVEQKRKRFEERHGLLNANMENLPHVDPFFEKHQRFAMMMLVTDGFYSFDTRVFEKYAKANIEALKKERTGILWVDETGNPRFVHFSFVEYFAAQWLISNPKTDVGKKMLRSLFMRQSYTLLRDFLERMLVEGTQATDENASGERKRLPLHEAVAVGDEERLAAALKSGASADATDAVGRTALHLAARFFKPNAISLLVDAGCDPTLRDIVGWSPLRYLEPMEVKSFFNRDREKYCVWLSILETLLRGGADHQDLNDHLQLREKHSPLNCVVNVLDTPQLALWWLRRNRGVCQYRTVLAEAVSHHLPNTVRSLLEHSDVTCVGWWKTSSRCPRGGDHEAAAHTAFSFALAHDFPHILRCVPDRYWQFRGIDQNCKDIKTLLHFAIETGKLQAADNILKEGYDARARTKIGFEPLHYAVKDNPWLDDDTRMAAVRLLVKYGANLDCKDIQGRGVLHYAASARIVTFLLDLGVDANCTDAFGRVALHSAAARGHQSAVEALLPHNEADQRDESGVTPLHLAAVQGHTAVVGLLVSRLAGKGIHVDTADVDGYTPLWYATGYSEAIPETLNIHGPIAVRRLPDESVPNDLKNDHLDSAAVLLAQGADPNRTDAMGRAPIHWAADKADVQLLALLLKHNVLVDKRDAFGRTALHLAAKEHNAEIVSMLLAHRADPKAADKEGGQSLNYIYKKDEWWKDCRWILRDLLYAGADPYNQDADGHAIICRAVAAGSKDTIAALFRHGVSLQELGVDVKDHREDDDTEDRNHRTSRAALVSSPRNRGSDIDWSRVFQSWQWKAITDF